jgi:hypothetical protein
MSEFAGRYQRLSGRTPGSFMWSTPGCRSLSPSWRSLRVGRCTTPMAAYGWTPSAGARRPLGVGPPAASAGAVPRVGQGLPLWSVTLASNGQPRPHPLIDHRFVDPPVRVPGNRYIS